MECPKDGGCGGDGYSPVPSTLTECANPMGGGGGGNVPLDPSARNSDASATRWLADSPPPLGARDGATSGAEGTGGKAITDVILESGVFG